MKKTLSILFGAMTGILLTISPVLAEEEIVEQEPIQEIESIETEEVNPLVLEEETTNTEEETTTLVEETETPIVEAKEESVVLTVQENNEPEITKYTGWNNKGTQYFIENVAVDGVQKINGNYYLFQNKTLQSFTGLVKNREGQWVHLKNGKSDFSFTGFSKSIQNNKWYFSRNGILDWTFTGVAKSIADNKWYHAKNGALDWSFTGLSKSVQNGKWYFSRKGALDWSFTGVAKSIANNKWYHAKNGALDWNFTGVSKSVQNGKWYFSRKGELDWNYTGGAKSVANNKWYAVNKGVITWKYTGDLKCTDGTTRYFLNSEHSTKSSWTGSVLTAAMGVNYGPSGKETYYNLPMEGVVSIMRSLGNNDPYWIRKDGVKMLGNYVMIAADFRIRPRGSLVETSLGTGIVCDTGSFVHSNSTQIDIAVTW